VQRIAFVRQGKCAEENMQHAQRSRACVYESERKQECERQITQKGDVKGMGGREAKKYQGSGSKVFQPRECFLSPTLS
jgi:hypothetical protein